MYKYLITAVYNEKGYEEERKFVYFSKDSAIITYSALKLSPNYESVQYYELTLIEDPE